MITFNVEVVTTSEAQIILRLGKIPKQAQDGFRRGAMAAAIMLANHIKEQKLSGQSLKTRTGTGRRSVRARQLGDGAAVVVDNVAWYLKLHEFGWKGKTGQGWDITPRGDVVDQLWSLQGNLIGGGGARALRFKGWVQTWSKVKGRPGQFRASTKMGWIFAKRVHHPGLEERSFMRAGLSELKSEMILTIERNIAAALRNKPLPPGALPS